MSNLKSNDNTNNYIKNIFKRKVKLGAVIQFNLLQEILEEIIKRQKDMEEQIENIEFRLNTSHINVKENNSISIDLEENIIKEEKNIKENSIKDNSNIKEDNNLKDDKENEEKNLKEENNLKVEKESKMEEKKLEIEKDKIKSEKEPIITKSKIRRNSFDKENEEKVDYKLDNLINVLSSRVDKLEDINREITKKIISLNRERQKEIEEIKNEINNETYPKLKEREEEIKAINDKLIHMQTKLDEVNIMDIYKIPDMNLDSNNADASLNLIKAIDQKVTKKIELIDSKTKYYDEQIASMKSAFNVSKNKSESAINLSNKIKENYDNLVNDIYLNNRDTKNKFDEKLKLLEEKLEKKIIDSKNESVKYTDEKSKKLKDLLYENIESITTNIPQNDNKIDQKMFVNLTNEKINNLNTELKEYFDKSINNSEKYIKSLINNIQIDKIKQKITEIEQELSDKLVKKDLNFITPKFEKIDNKHIEFENDLYDFRKEIEKINETCQRTVKMVDYLGGQVIQSYQPDLEKINQMEESKSKIDTSIYLTKNIFKEEINIIYKKLEKIVEFHKDNYKSIQDLEKKLKFFVTEKDLNNFEHCLMNILEEFKNEVCKKFYEKAEAQKNLKYIELQIKNISENNILNNANNNNNADNWLLAKKPINNYMCASCESIIGDLNNKTHYLPWNKMLSKDEKKYRMGHGFSRMLQMINADLLKNAEKVNFDLTMKNEDKKIINYFNNSLSNEGKQLPRINSQINFHKMDISNQTPKSLNVENHEINEKENSENNSNINLNNNIDNSQNDTSRRRKKNIIDDTNSPKMLKIYKKTKK